MLRFASFFLVCLASIFRSEAIYAETNHVVMGTGGVTGVYYPAGGAVCQMVNHQFKERALRCFVESGEGSVQNLHRLRKDEIDLAIVQNDWKVHAWQGTSEFKEYGENRKLRHVINLYSESFTVVARKDSNIRTFDDLKGRRVNIGNIGSGQRATMEWLLSVVGWWKADFAEVHEFAADDQARALCDDKFDAMVFVSGSPNSSVKLATTDCDSVIIPVQSEKISAAIEGSNIYIKTSIPGGVYRGNPNDIPTFGVSAKLVSTTDVEPGKIHSLITSLFEEFNQFRRLHPALHHLDRVQVLQSDEHLPLHDGVKRFLKQVGMANQ